MPDYVFLILLILHVGAIVGWLGAALVFGSVISPSMRSMTPQGRTDFTVRILPRYLGYALATSIAALVFGVLLYAYSVVLHPSLGPSNSGSVLIQAGAGIGLIAFILVVAYIGPNGRNLIKMEKAQPSSPESPKFQMRLRRGAGIVTGLLVIVLILMISGSVV